jgi:hypothetical protein
MIEYLTPYTKTLSEIAQMLAFTAAAIYFLWKWLSGYLVTNLSIEPVLKRQRKFGDVDLLCIDVKFTKGDIGSVVLTQVRIKVRNEKEPKDLFNIKLSSPFIEEKNRMIRLSPGESTQFAHLIEVPSGICCYIEIYVQGCSGYFPKRFSMIYSHWKASVYSLPIESNTSKKNTDNS